MKHLRQMRIGISNEDIASAVSKIGNCRMLFVNSNVIKSDAEREMLIKEFQDSVVEVMSDITFNVRTEINMNKYESLLIEDLTLDVWNKIDKKSQLYLKTAKLMFNMLINTEVKFDYSGVCLEITKAVELEISKRFYGGYIEYLNKYYPLQNCINEWPTCALNKDKTKILENNSFTLGSVKYFVSINSNGKVLDNKAYKVFSEYAKKMLYKNNISDTERSKKLLNCVIFTERVRSDFRNPAAHRNELSYTTAKECLDYVVEIQKKLKEILLDFKV